MKKILFIILIITLPLIAFFQYKEYTRFNPPSSYEYMISEAIDANYHDPELVTEYFSKAIEIGSFARTKWRSESIDVRFPDQNSTIEMNAANYYNQLLARTKQLEAVLSNSKNLKDQNFSDSEIKFMESGFPRNLIESRIDRNSMVQLAIGSNSRFVWKLQERLISKGYPHTLDGLFGTATQTALITYQNDQGIFPSGAMNDEVFDLLFLK
ncbi:MAG: peptidoglycan-binding protein [Cyclobacteriaceae bacterium]